MNTQPESAPGAPVTEDEQGQAPEQSQQQGTTSEPTTPEPPKDKGQAPKPQEPQDVASLPQWAQDVIKTARDQAAENRTEKQNIAKVAQEAQKQRDAVLKALGLTEDGDEDPDPGQLTEQLDTLTAQRWETGVENAILRVAGKAGADADELLDSVKFLDSLGEFVEDDPHDAGFRDKLATHIGQFIKDNPRYKAQAQAAKPTGKSGTAMPGAPTPPQQKKRPTSLFDAVRSATGGG